MLLCTRLYIIRNTDIKDLLSLAYTVHKTEYFLIPMDPNKFEHCYGN